MIKLLLTTLALLAGASLVHAQSIFGKYAADSTGRRNDSVILENIIKPLVIQANASQEMPDWQVLGQDISVKYGDSYVDRNVTKAKIYYYFGKDWPLFSRALVHYTEAYENKEDLKLMNKNAKMVLQYSQDQDELKTALVWVKHAVDKEPGNTTYKSTYDGLVVKIKASIPKS